MAFTGIIEYISSYFLTKPKNDYISHSQLLFMALDMGQGDTALALLDMGINPNAKYRGKTPLMIACERGLINVIDKLIEMENVDVNAQDDDGRTALMNACIDRYDKYIKKLLSREDINVHIKDNAGEVAKYDNIP